MLKLSQDALTDQLVCLLTEAGQEFCLMVNGSSFWINNDGNICARVNGQRVDYYDHFDLIEKAVNNPCYDYHLQ